MSPVIAVMEQERRRMLTVVVDVAIETDAWRDCVGVGQRESSGWVIKFGIEPGIRAMALLAS